MKKYLTFYLKAAIILYSQYTYTRHKIQKYMKHFMWKFLLYCWLSCRNIAPCTWVWAGYIWRKYQHRELLIKTSEFLDCVHHIVFSDKNTVFWKLDLFPFSGENVEKFLLRWVRYKELFPNTKMSNWVQNMDKVSRYGISLWI